MNIKYLLERREYYYKRAYVSIVGIFDSKDEAIIKKRAMKKVPHRPNTLRFYIRPIAQ